MSESCPISNYEQVIARYISTVRMNKYIPHEPTAKQALFLMHDHIPEILFGGAAGPGKTDGLLMAALQYVDVPEYAALLLRRTYSDLALPGAIMDRSHEWLEGKDVHWSDDKKTWTFPSGATLTFGYLDGPRDQYRYQSSEFQFCCAEGTPVLMADGSYKPIEQVKEGDEVKTLQGSRGVTKSWGARLASCVRAVVYDQNHKKTGEQIHPADHQILTPGGWFSYASICTLCGISEPTRCPHVGKCLLHTLPRSQSPGQNLLSPFVTTPQYEHGLSLQDHPDCAGISVSSVMNQNYCGVFGDGLPEDQQPLSWCVPVILHAPLIHQDLNSSCDCAQHGGHSGMVATSDYQENCLQDSDPCDARSLDLKDTVRDVLPSQDDVVKQIPRDYMLGGLGTPQLYNPVLSFVYAHPHTKELQTASEGVRYGSCVLTPIGERTVYDITVSDVHHYITLAGLININCGFDELSQFKEKQYLYLHSRLRRLIGSDIPIRMRAASNPGDIGHEWVKSRFISPETRAKDCMFIPALLSDNPHLDRESYIKSLEKLDPVTLEQLLNGNWDVRPEGGLFKREWLKLIDAVPRGPIPLCRYWDKAATQGGGDWTVGALIGLYQGQCIVLDIKRTQSRPAGVEAIILQTAQLDGPEVMIRMEQEPGSAGVDVIDHYARQVLIGYNFKGVKSTGSKVSRAAALSTAAEQGNLLFLNRAWTGACMDELVLFPTEGAHDDQVDAVSGGYNVLALRQGGHIRFAARTSEKVRS